MSQVNINLNTNQVEINTTNNQISVTNPDNPSVVNITQPVTNVIEVITSGPQGPQGIPGPIPDTGSFVTTGSFNAFTSSYNTGSFSGSFTGNLVGSASFASTASFAQSGNGSFSGSFSGSGANLSGIPASGIVGLNLSQIATGSVTASVSPTQFSVTSGSSTELVVTGTGVTIGSVITDTHRVTGSLNISGSVTATNFTGSLFGTASQAISASWAPLNAGGSDTQIQFNSGSRLLGTGSFTFNYQSQSLQHGLSVTASGLYSHAEGAFTHASGPYSHAEGSSTIASSQYAHAEGANSQAIGDYSHAEGSSAIASGPFSHAEGEATQAIGQSSHAEGQSTQAIGDYSHAEGIDTQAIGNYSHVEGFATIALGDYQHVQGQYNITSSEQSAFIIGNGADNSNRSNLVFASGSIFQVTGSLDVTGSSTLIGTQTITGSNGRLIYKGTTPAEVTATLAEIHANDDLPWLHRFYNDTFSTSSAVMAYYGHNDGRFVFHNESTQSIGLQVNGYSAENGLLVYSDKVTFVNNAEVTGSLLVSGSITGSLFGTSSWSNNAISSSFAATASFAPAYLPLTGGTISGSLVIQNNLTVLGSASIQYISESTLNIGTNLITVNTINPGARFGGLAVIDSGSSPQVSASFLYDSVQDEFIFVHRGTSTSAVTSSHFVLGPETYNDLGNEIYLTANRIPKSVGNEHLNDSNISDNGSVVSINSNSEITGSLSVTQGITGSLFGTSSFASTASFAPAYLPIAVPQTTGLVISFTEDRVYGTFALPETGSAITSNTASAILGVTNLIIHSASVAPTTGSDFKKLTGSSDYVAGLNYIYCTYIANNQIIYSINQAT